MSAPFRVLLLGCGAVGSRLAPHLPSDVALLGVDREVVGAENVGVAAFTSTDVAGAKAAVVAERFRERGGGAHALVGDVRYAVRPGLVRAVDVVVVALDNRAAILDACIVAWAAHEGLPVLVVGCGSEREYQVRACVTPRVCVCCTWTNAERFEEAPGEATSCADTSAPRAAAGAAECAAVATARLITALRGGDRRCLGRRLQSDGGPEFVIDLPSAAVAGCPVPHHPGAMAVESLGESIVTLTVEALAARAIACAGPDAEILLGRRAVPLGGSYCPRCRRTSPAPLRLLPAALRAAPCGCAGVRPLGERSAIGAAELLRSPEAPLALAAFGAGHGDVFVASGRDGTIALAAAFDWSDLAPPEVRRVAV